MMYKLFAIVLLFTFFPLNADIGSDLKDFFEKSGMTMNVTTPGAHKDQSAGYYSGGSASMRTRVKNAQLASIQLPHINAGCGGIDMFLGGFSHINARALIDALRNIGTNAAGYAFKLSIKTIAPMIDGVMEDLNALATEINQANINSCETAATLLGGVWPKSDLTSRHICTSMSSEGGRLRDWAAARQDCGAGGKRSGIVSAKDGRQGYQDAFIEDFNVAWEAIKKNSFLMSNKDLAHLCLTLTGTIISSFENERSRITTYQGRVNNDDVLKALRHGGSLKIYVCSDISKCLKLTEQSVNISPQHALDIKVSKILQSISEKALRDETFSSEEIAFIENVKLPIYKILNVNSAFKRSEFDLTGYTEIISTDLLYQYLIEILDLVAGQAANLRNAQVSDEQILSFLDQVHKSKSHLMKMRTNAYNEINQKLMLIESTRINEQRLESLFNEQSKGGF